MNSRRAFIKSLFATGSIGYFPQQLNAQEHLSSLYDIKRYGQVRLMHLTDSHGQLSPNFFREASINLGFHGMYNRPPHLVGNSMLNYYQLSSTDLRYMYAYTYLNFDYLAHKYGKTGGYAHIATLVKKLRAEYGAHKCILLDGGDTWQGSGLSLWYSGEDMVQANNLLGVDAMTGHWEFTYPEKQIRKNIELSRAEFLAQNIFLTEDAAFDDQPAYDEDSGRVFKPYSIMERDGWRIAVIGQAFPYTSIANPQRFIPNWSFGIRETEMQEVVNEVRTKADVVVILSHNGMDVDLKMASRLDGVDIILGGHTHDITPKPIMVKNSNGVTHVVSSGSHGKCLSVFDLHIKKGKLVDFHFSMLPIFSEAIAADPPMQALINKLRQPYEDNLGEKIAENQSLLYRRGNFNGSFDQLICDALRAETDSQIALSPGFRWGTSIPANTAITRENLLAQTAMTYPETYKQEMTGAQIKLILEDVADNLYNADPYYQQGGDMVRTGGLQYILEPLNAIGHRIDNLRLVNGKQIKANKKYTVSGWSTVGSQSEGEAVYDLLERYAKNEKSINITQVDTPEVKGRLGNNGWKR